MTKHFKPVFRQEVAELVVDKGYSIRDAAEAMGVGKSTVNKWARDLRKERNGERDFKKGYRSLDVGLNEKFTLIEGMEDSYPIKSLCEVFGVHRSSYRYWKVNANKI
jgi:putative transposase